MSWRCPKCGIESRAGERHCEACGYVEYGTLILNGETGRSLSANIDTDVGQRLLRVIDEGQSRHAATLQFRLVRSAALRSWAISACSGTANSTEVDGTAVGEDPVALHDGATVTIGGTKMRLVVRICHM